MSDELSAYESLRKFRELLVEERRRIVRVALETHAARGQGGGLQGANFHAVQEQIESVDRALTEEEGQLQR